jgi:hypothetical protein
LRQFPDNLLHASAFSPAFRLFDGERHDPPEILALLLNQAGNDGMEFLVA